MPEKAAPKHETLSARWKGQRQYKEAWVAHRHEDAVNKLVAESMEQARLRAKLQRVRQGLKPTGEASSSSGSTDETDDSDSLSL